MTPDQIDVIARMIGTPIAASLWLAGHRDLAVKLLEADDGAEIVLNDAEMKALRSCRSHVFSLEELRVMDGIRMAFRVNR